MIGDLDVDRLLGSIPSHLLSEWMAYDELEPQSVDLLPTMLANLSSLYANVNRDPDKRRIPFTAEDFLPREPEANEQPSGQTVDQQIDIAAMWVAATGGRDLRKDK